MYKNWKAICQIPDTHVMWALALLNMDSDLGRRFMERFPEYFTQEEQAGPYPLSVLRMEAEENAARQGCPGMGANHLTTYDAIPSSMPILYFAEDDALKRYAEAKPLPPELRHADVVGTTYVWEDKEIVLIQYLDDRQWWFVPAELIAVDR